MNREAVIKERVCVPTRRVYSARNATTATPAPKTMGVRKACVKAARCWIVTTGKNVRRTRAIRRLVALTLTNRSARLAYWG